MLKMDSIRKCVPKLPTTNWILCVSILIVFISCNECSTLKRSASPDFNSENSESSLDKLNVNYDEYPVRKCDWNGLTFWIDFFDNKNKTFENEKNRMRTTNLSGQNVPSFRSWIFTYNNTKLLKRWSMAHLLS